MSKHKLKAELAELRAEVKRLELLLSQHATDCTRHATPAVVLPSCWPDSIDPADGWPPNVVVTTTTWVADNAEF